MGSIQFFDRKIGQLREERVYGEGALRWVYESRLGQRLAESFLTRPWVSRVYGKFQDMRLSARKISGFIQRFGIDLQEFEGAPYSSFNDFFIRRFRPGVRHWDENPSSLAAFAEARYFALASSGGGPSGAPLESLTIKGVDLTAPELLGGDFEKAKPFLGGPVLLARLCPVDYHRFHFPDDGRVLEHYRVKGPLHSVNPVALAYDPAILIRNERQVTILDTRHFGKLAYVEVGALCVGRIVQTHSAVLAGGGEFRRGEEKGYFLFGGSTVVVLGEPGRWRPDSDLLQQTQQGRETLIRLGERVAVKA